MVQLEIPKWARLSELGEPVIALRRAPGQHPGALRFTMYPMAGIYRSRSSRIHCLTPRRMTRVNHDMLFVSAASPPSAVASGPARRPVIVLMRMRNTIDGTPFTGGRWGTDAGSHHIGCL